MVDGYFGAAGDGDAEAVAGAGGSEALDASPLRRGNFMARARMAVLYDLSVTWGGLVVGTGNKTESLIGYTTLFGDSACAFNPVGDLYKSQVRQLVARHGRPRGDHAQGAVGGPLAGPDRRGRGRVLLPRARPAAVLDDRPPTRSTTSSSALGFEPATIARVDRLVAGSEFKRQVPPIAKLGPRTTGVDYLYPRRRPGSARS